MLLTDLISISHEHLIKKLMVCLGDQNKLVTNLLKSNSEHKIVHIMYYNME